MTRDEYFDLKKKYLRVGFDNIPDAEMDEFIKWSEYDSKMPGTDALFGGDSLQQVKRMFYRMSEIPRVNRKDIVSIKSGLRGIDQSIYGFNKGELTVVSGTNGSGKSTWLTQVALEAATQGFKTVVFSGELPAYRVKDWMTLQAAGRDHLVQDGPFWHVESKAAGRITEWMDDKVFVYNNDYSMGINDIMRALEYFALIAGVDAVVLDNLMSIDLTAFNGKNVYEKQTELTKMLSAYAKKRQVHIFFVCHPRKSIGFIRKYDVSGTADLANLADNVVIVHRVNNDFKRQTKEYFKWSADNEIYQCGNVIEICKNRDLGVEDHFAESYFDTRAKRFLNFDGENKGYGWEQPREYQGSLPDGWEAGK